MKFFTNLNIYYNDLVESKKCNFFIYKMKKLDYLIFYLKLYWELTGTLSKFPPILLRYERRKMTSEKKIEIWHGRQHRKGKWGRKRGRGGKR